MNINISEETVTVYAEETDKTKELLQSLKLRIKSGSFNSYDIALYNALVKKVEENQKTYKLK